MISLFSAAAYDAGAQEGGRWDRRVVLESTYRPRVSCEGVGSTSGFVLEYGVGPPAHSVISLSKVQMETQGRSKRGAKMEPSRTPSEELIRKGKTARKVKRRNKYIGRRD